MAFKRAKMPTAPSGRTAFSRLLRVNRHAVEALAINRAFQVGRVGCFGCRDAAVEQALGLKCTHRKTLLFVTVKNAENRLVLRVNRANSCVKFTQLFGKTGQATAL